MGVWEVHTEEHGHSEAQLICVRGEHLVPLTL